MEKQQERREQGKAQSELDQQYPTSLLPQSSQKEGEQSNQTLLNWIQSYAFFQGSECPSQFRYQSDDLYPSQILAQLLVAPLTWIGRLHSGSDY